MVSTLKTPFFQIYINLPREVSVFSFLNSYLDLDFEVIGKADNYRYGNGNDICLVNLGPIALCSRVKLTSSGGNHFEENGHALIVPLMYKLLTSIKCSDDLCIGFDRD